MLIDTPDAVIFSSSLDPLSMLCLSLLSLVPQEISAVRSEFKRVLVMY